MEIFSLCARVREGGRGVISLGEGWEGAEGAKVARVKEVRGVGGCYV